MGAPRRAGLERWIEYESRLTHALAQHNCLALCQYNRRLFPPEVILNSHPHASDGHLSRRRLPEPVLRAAR
jgi:hypothetical protein